MICLDCLRGSVYNHDSAPATARCEVCGDTRLCMKWSQVALFVPYIPLQICDIFDTQPIVDKNQCPECKGKRVILSACMGCGENKCHHLMKPCSPHCLACVASRS